jgi:hypothetical protein
MKSDHHEKVRQLAHQIWEDEGKPDGRAQEHWGRAEEMVRAALKAKPAKPKAETKPKAKAPPKPKKSA